MSNILKLYDVPLLEFEFIRTVDNVTLELLNDFGNDKLLPLDCSLDEKSIYRWLKNRTIPAKRAYASNLLARNGLNEKDTAGIIDICKGLSLNDSYWVVDSAFDGKFEDYNLYDNRFNRMLSFIAFTGYGSYVGSTFRSSPEFTTGGMLAKCWRRIDGDVVLFKTGTEGFANSGMEPYSEFYASQIAQYLGIPSVRYGLSRWHEKICSTCRLFTNKDLSFISAGRLIEKGGIQVVLDYYKNLGKKYYDSLIDMFVFDALIFNEDRHLGNFGFLVDNHTNSIIDMAPVFDNGLSLFCYGMADDIDNLDKYAGSRAPALYNSFDEFTGMVITDRQKKMLSKMADFRFSKHSRYNWPEERLKKIEAFVKQRAIQLIKE
jgi:hypothetical protein